MERSIRSIQDEGGLCPARALHMALANRSGQIYTRIGSSSQRFSVDFCVLSPSLSIFLVTKYCKPFFLAATFV
ncbi:hypothetical protein Plhal304r1_c022g0077111 [Plasmopara halstedii]